MKQHFRTHRRAADVAVHLHDIDLPLGQSAGNFADDSQALSRSVDDSFGAVQAYDYET